jgi:hypothetical protein
MASRFHSRNLDSKNPFKFFGFEIPNPLAAVIDTLCSQVGGDTDRCRALFFEVTGYFFVGQDARYQQTPPELFPIGTMGVDGVHMEYVIHAPELSAADHPIGYMCPMDPDGVILIGNSTLEAIENLMSFELSLESPDISSIQSVSEALGLCPTEAKTARRYDSDGNGLMIQPVLPNGWRHVPSSDGVGVLAPQEQFVPGKPKVPDVGMPAKRFAQKARRTLDRGYAATALYYLREGFWRHWTDTEAAVALSELLVKAYHSLGRPSLAQIAKQRIEMIKETSQRMAEIKEAAVKRRALIESRLRGSRL